MRILGYDIESKPNLNYTWGLHNQFIAINQIKEPQGMICWSTKEFGKKGVEYGDVTEKGGHSAMVKRLYKLLSEADAVCTYNGNSFDNKMLNAELVLLGLAPLPPVKQIDLYRVVKKHFRFPSYKLDYVSRALGIGEKVQHEGFGLWRGCMDGDPKAWKRMRRYNEGDVLLLERLYNRLLPWINNHPSRSLETESHVCPNCGSDKLQHRGYQTTKVARYKRLQCQKCGAWSRERVSEVENKEQIVVGI